MARIVGNRNLTNLQDSNADLDNLAMGSTITNTQNIDVLPPIYEPRYAAQPYRPHEGLYSTMNNQTRFAPDWSDSNYAAKYGYNRPYNMGDVAGEVGEYSQRPAPTINAQDQGSKGFNLSNFFPGKAIYEGIAGMLPKQDPRQIALTDFYGGKNNLRDGQTIQGGLMAGYNPVSGGLLNTLTAGKFGKEPTYGLQGAYDKRMARIEKTLGSKYGLSDAQIQDIYAGDLKEEEQYNTQLIQRLRDLKKAKTDELAMLNNVTGNNTGDTTITTDTSTGDGGGYDPNVHGPTNYGVGSGGQQSYDTGQGFGAHATSGGPVSNKTGRGRQDWAQGGRIGYNRGRVVNPGGYQGDEFEDENIFEFMQDQGVPHSQMVEGKSPFDLRIDELMDTGMSWQEAYEIAKKEFGQIAEGGDSFSEEGIASIV